MVSNLHGGAVGRVLPLVAGILVVLYSLSVTYALCQLSTQSEPDALVSLVYGPESLRTGSQLLNAGPVATVNVERNEVVVTDANGTSYVVDETPGQAVDLSRTDTFFKNKTAKGGPFFFSCIIDDTLRIAKGMPYDFGYGEKLHERFEGRVEKPEEVVQATFNEMAQFFANFVDALKKPRIKNVIRGEDFTATAVCASSVCEKDMYSLFMRYLNIGGSTQMVLEFVGGAIYRYAIPTGLKIRLNSFQSRIIGRAKAFVKGGADELMKDVFSDLSDDAKVAITKYLQGAGSLDDILKLPVDQRRKALMFVNLFENYADDIAQKADAVARAINTVQSLEDLEKLANEGFIKEVKELRDSIRSAEEVLGNQSFLYIKTQEGTVDALKLADQLDEAVSLLDKLKKTGGLSDKELEELRQCLAAAASLREMKTGVEQAQHVLTKNLPVSGGLMNSIREWTAEWKPTNKFAKEWAVNLPLFYILRGGLFTAAPSWGGQAFFGIFPSGFGVVRRPSPIPPEWKVIRLVPPDSPEFGDSFVDILANHGVDPGDLFRAVVTWSAEGVLSQVFEATGRPLPLVDQMFSTQHESRRREMKTAILALALDDPRCPDCSISVQDNRIVFSAPKVGAGVFVTENSKKESGSNLILFAHHLNIDFGDAKIDLDDAKREGKDCESSCPIVKHLRNLTFGLVDDPRGAMFIYASLTSFAYTVPGLGLWFMPIDMLLSVQLVDPCFSCIDTTGGYYIHLFAPHVEEDVPLGEADVADKVTEFLEKILPENNALKQKINELKGYLKSEEIKKENVVFQAYVNGLDSGEISTPYIITFWTKAEELVPSTYSTQGSVKVATLDGNVLIDTLSGNMSINGATVLNDPDRIRLYSVDTQVPGILVPSMLVYTNFSGSGVALEATSASSYLIHDPQFITCVQTYFGNLYKVFGDLLEIHTSEGVIKLGDSDITASLSSWSGKMTKVSVYGDYKVIGEGVDFVQEGNKLVWSTKDVDAGELLSMIFENAVVVRKGDTLIVWVKYLGNAPKEGVADISVKAGKNGFTLSMTPRTDVPEEVKKAVEDLSNWLQKIGEIRAIKAQNGSVALVRTPDGLELRVYDANGSLIYSELVKDMYVDPNDPSKLIIETNAGRHELKIDLAGDGTPTVSLDGKNMGIPQVFQGENGFLWYDPTTGWQLVNASLLPLVDAFKNGIKVSLEGGNLVGAPAGSSYVLTPKKEKGLVLPFLDPLTFALLILVMLGIVSLRSRGWRS